MLNNYFTTPKTESRKSNMVFSCGPSQEECRLIPEDHWKIDSIGCRAFKLTAPLYCWFLNEQGERVFKRVTGPVIFVASGDALCGGEKARGFRSKIVEDPTYRSLMGAAQSSQKVTRDYHHQFIEGCYFKGYEEIDGRRVIVLQMVFGS